MKDITDLVFMILDKCKELGIQPFYIAVIVFLTWLMKSFDLKNRFKQGFVMFPLASSLFVCYIGVIAEGAKQNTAKWIFTSLIHAGLGAWGYDIWSSFRKQVKDKMNKKEK